MVEEVTGLVPLNYVLVNDFLQRMAEEGIGFELVPLNYFLQMMVEDVIGFELVPVDDFLQ